MSEEALIDRNELIIGLRRARRILDGLALRGETTAARVNMCEADLEAELDRLVACAARVKTALAGKGTETPLPAEERPAKRARDPLDDEF